MATIDQNPIWDKVANAPGSVSDSIMGPSYSYSDNIPGPASKGVGTRGTIGQLATNTGAIFDYMKYMISGPALGNQYFVNSGGTCSAPDKSIQTRHNYINNVSNGRAVLPEAMKRDLGSVASDFNGLIPGMLEDVEGLNPVNLFSSLSADSTPECGCYTCPTSGGDQSRFLTPSLSPDLASSKCVQVDMSKCVQTKEGFSDDTGYGIGAAAVGVLGVALILYYLR